MLTSCKRISAVMLGLPVAAAMLTVLASIALGGQPSISVEHAWSRATPVGADVAVGYFTIQNNGATPDRLVSITTDIAQPQRDPSDEHDRQHDEDASGYGGTSRSSERRGDARTWLLSPHVQRSEAAIEGG